MSAVRHHLRTQQEFTAYLARVGEELGPNSRTEPHSMYGNLCVALVDDDGRRLIAFQPDRARSDEMRIRALLPDESPIAAPVIGVSALEPRHVAKAIRSRLYPKHADALARSHEALTAREAQRQRHEQTAALLLSAYPQAEALSDIPRQGATSVMLNLPGTSHVRAEVWPTGSTVDIQAHVTPAEAKAMLRALAVHHDRQARTP
ncbi:hypothetical protein [Streptomyces sp. NPDC058595]|uniref:hypothetical protein n=1 Tax=Streptomyces sp. NPDC058595 TaxID=3346550 RepID=UPI003663B11F